ncbi:DELTA-sagatoxin-Srs1a [Larimichthys crocea]|uniref:DELTA-sagatoxin-Srs1a n=1 Tax=Larimichthys crocea TaxID=215358 RepID=A0A6G0HW36_LARCR|nr:DELTA-sagatoxin-Srs1a [Larimichthys crocea]
MRANRNYRAQPTCLTPKAKMPETAEAVSATLTTNRNCTIEITNVSANYCLINPKVYMSSGFSQHPPQPTVRTTKTEVCSFTKDDNTATGAVGLLTYDLFNMKSRFCSERMAIMFSVPYDYNLYKNRLAVGVVAQSHACDKHLYSQMYDGKDLRCGLPNWGKWEGFLAPTEVFNSHSNMTESAEAVAADVASRRSVTIEISNVTNNYCLIEPRVYLDNGQTFNPPQPTVRPLKTEVCTFTKSSGKATGSIGVLTYDLFERSRNDYIETLAIMFSVPWDYNLYKNWFAVGIYKKGRNCDKDLFKEMYYEKNQQEHGFVREEANGSGITYVGNYLDIKATMCPMGKAIMKVEVWDKLFTH